MELQANSSNNTIFADADGDIAYFHGNFIPRRDTSSIGHKPVDGSNPATEWQGLLSIDETPHLLNPKSGWLYNSNNWPWSAAGASSPKKEDYPAYVETGGETARGLHAIRVLQNKKDFTLDSLIAAAYDSYLTWFEKPIPCADQGLGRRSRDRSAEGEAGRARSRVLREWDLRWGVDSVPTSLAVFWGEDIRQARRQRSKKGGRLPSSDYVGTKAPPQAAAAIARRGVGQTDCGFRNLENAMGRHQSIPAPDRRHRAALQRRRAEHSGRVHFVASGARWPRLGRAPYPGTKKWYGTSGNSFVAVVEFGENVRARAVTAGGESGNPSSPHFNDEAKRYATGDLREVYFYPVATEGTHGAEYHPGS